MTEAKHTPGPTGHRASIGKALIGEEYRIRQRERETLPARLRDYAEFPLIGRGHRGGLIRSAMVEAATEIDRLKALNAELVAALEGCVGYLSSAAPNSAHQQLRVARAAIAKATGEQPSGGGRG